MLFEFVWYYGWLHFRLQMSLLLGSKQFYCCQNSIVPHTTKPGGHANNICALLCAMFPNVFHPWISLWNSALSSLSQGIHLVTTVLWEILLVPMLKSQSHQSLFNCDSMWLLQSMEKHIFPSNDHCDINCDHVTHLAAVTGHKHHKRSGKGGQCWGLHVRTASAPLMSAAKARPSFRTSTCHLDTWHRLTLQRTNVVATSKKIKHEKDNTDTDRHTHTIDTVV